MSNLSKREEVWLTAWVNTARSDSCVKISTATNYADSCLRDFDTRFPPQNVDLGKRTLNG